MTARSRTVVRRSPIVVGVLTSVFVVALAGSPAVFAQGQQAVDLLEMTLEDLLTLEVTSAGKKDQLISETAAAIYVITADDIRRSHAATIMELLRQVPGMHVAREKTGRWSIGIRGFTHDKSNKLLVLMDGRSLYTPVYAGVEWDAQDTLLEDIQRIEIIRGPGASLWGANAVNGVINIITKDAKDTHGGAVSYQAGTLENGTVAARYGGALGGGAHYRAFTKYFDRPGMPDANGVTPWGGWSGSRHGGRVDWAAGARDRLTITGEWSLINVRELDHEMTAATFPFEAPVEEHDRTKASFVLAHWSHKQADGGVDVQFFYDRVRNYDGNGHDVDETVGTADLEFQHRLKVATSHDLLWGVGFRQVRDRVGPALASWFTPERFTARTYNAFLHDEATWRDKTIRVTAGSKLEWNAFSGFEIQPNVRVLWAPTPVHSVWTAASRAVRAPSRYEVHQVSIEDVEEQDGDVVYSLFVPPAAFRSETVTAYEAGYRFVPTRRLSLDVSSFYNVYDHLQTVETGTQQRSALPIAGLMTPLGRTNAGSGKVSGAEVLAYWTISGALQVSGSYTALHMRMDRTGLPHNEHGDRVEDQYAANMFFVRAYANLPYAVELNSDLRFVDRVRGEGVPAYFEGSVHVSREVVRGLRVTGSVDNILHRRHGEWDEGELTVPRGLRIGLDWRF